LEDYPCEVTIARWIKWGRQLIRNAEGKMRETANRVLDFSNEFLGSTKSLLEGIKEFAPRGWLPFMIDIMIRTGGEGAIPNSS